MKVKGRIEVRYWAWLSASIFFFMLFARNRSFWQYALFHPAAWKAESPTAESPALCGVVSVGASFGTFIYHQTNW